MSFLAQGSWGTSRTAMVLLGAPGRQVCGALLVMSRHVVTDS